MISATIFLISLLVSGIAGPFILRGLVALKSRQTIHKDAPQTHQVKAGTPTMGGLIILAGAIPALVYASTTGIKEAVTALILLLGFGLIGFIDDYVVPKMLKGKRGLGWIPKLVMQIGLAVAASWNLPIWAMAVSVFFILFFTNAYNFSDGLDGLAGSLAVWLSIGFGLHSYPSIAFALLGGLIVFLCFNAPPAKVFMGDVGALAIGAVFGYLFFLNTYSAATPDFTAYVSSKQFWVFALMSVVMIAELVPVPLQIFWVKVFKKKLFPFTPIHHAFENAGWPETRVTFMFVMIQAAAVLLGMSLGVTHV